MTIASFAPTATINLAIGTTSANVQLPSTGSPTAALVTNPGEHLAFVQLGTSNTVAASTTTSIAVPPFPAPPVALTLGANTWIAGISLAGVGNLNIAVGS
ncbi:hypothetical protein [Paraburkholderia unamae]|uniref:Uncharacterized protein n=1 Tax=Paraburkholderia unamae TaxID=219649 RepID=A0ABX5K6T5_9BURK|nr:hypothetical protein [Paraburkholderia unamae]PVX61246.1 hypothetical protein C7402_14237 [Paraburkholderia unamae]